MCVSWNFSHITQPLFFFFTSLSCQFQPAFVMVCYLLLSVIRPNTHTRTQSYQRFVLVNHWCESWHLCGFCFLLGDGGNDVSMIQEADCGVGVEGKVRLCPSHCLSLACCSDTFSLCVSCQDLSHVQRHAYRWFLFVGIYCLSRGNKDDRMLLCSSKSNKPACLYIPCQDGQFDMDLIHLWAVILYGTIFFDLLGNSVPFLMKSFKPFLPRDCAISLQRGPFSAPPLFIHTEKCNNVIKPLHCVIFR